MAGAILWHRVDGPGHDACRLVQTDSGWQVEGAAVFQHCGRPAYLAYVAACDTSWRALGGYVRGGIGDRAVEFGIARSSSGAWTIDGKELPDLRDCQDLDFGFTPSTNFLHLRRLALDIGQRADVPAAWLDVSTGTLDVLVQRYERRSTTTYWYEAPRFNYAAMLEIDHAGFVVRYPDLWESVP